MSKTPLTAKKELESEGSCTSFDGAMRHAHNGWKLARSLELQLAACQRALEVAVLHLNAIASWREGPEVNSSFDEPASTAVARSALARIEAAKEGK